VAQLKPTFLPAKRDVTSSGNCTDGLSKTEELQSMYYTNRFLDLQIPSGLDCEHNVVTSCFLSVFFNYRLYTIPH